MIVWSENWAQASFSTRKRWTAFPSPSLLRGSKPGKCVFAGGCGPSQGGLPGVAGLGPGGKTAFPSVGEMEGQVTLNKTCLPVTGGRDMARFTAS